MERYKLCSGGAVTQNVPEEIDFSAKSCDRKDRSDPMQEQGEKIVIFSTCAFLSGRHRTVGFDSTSRWGSREESSKEKHKIDPGARKPDKRFLLKGKSDSLLHVGDFSVTHLKAQCLEVKVRQIQL